MICYEKGWDLEVYQKKKNEGQGLEVRPHELNMSLS